MTRLLLCALALAAMTSLAMAEPSTLTDHQMGKVTAGVITQTNKGGQVPNGVARGIPATNPAGHAPPGQNKNLAPGRQ